MAYLSEIKRLFNKRSEKYDSIYVDESNQLLHKEKHRRANLTIEWGGRYLGDLKGGQMIAKRVPGEGKYYQFEDADKLEIFIRSQLREDQDFVEECDKCFDSAITFRTDDL